MTGQPKCESCGTPMSMDDVSDPLFATVCKTCHPDTRTRIETEPEEEPVDSPDQMVLPPFQEGEERR